MSVLATPPTNAPLGSSAMVALLALVFGIAAFATDMYLPAFPAIRASFDASHESVQLSLSLFLYGNAAGHLVLGPLSDRFGRRPVLMAGLAAYAVASLGCALAGTIGEFLACRALQGAAASSGPVLVRALINDRLEREQAAQMLALLTGLMAFGAMLTPAFGGWFVQRFTWQWLFFVLAAAGTVLFVAVTLRLRESLPPERRVYILRAQSVARGYVTIAASPAFWGYVLPPALMFAGVFAYAVVNSFLLIDELGVSEQTQGVLYSVAAGAYVSGSLVSRWLVRRCGIERAVALGIALGCVAATGAVLASAFGELSVLLVVLPGLCHFFAAALILPLGFAAAVSLFPARAGSASAVAGFVQLTVAGASAGFAALLYDSTTWPLHVFTLACCTLAAAVWIGAGTRRR